MTLWLNPWRGSGLPDDAALAGGEISTNVDAVLSLLKQCPIAKETPLIPAPKLAEKFGIDEVWVKDERRRMNLGSFKALGAAYAIAKQAIAVQQPPGETTPLAGITYCCASAGNHGLSLAAGARIFGAKAVVYLSTEVPANFSNRLQAKGARVVHIGKNYEESLAAAEKDAEANDWVLLSDTSWPGYTQLPRDIMEGYLVMGAEVAAQIPRPPTHIFLQAGVGGLAAAATAMARKFWGDNPEIIVVEPSFAPALLESARAGRPVTATGAVSCMGRLDCKQPSHLALAFLAREADAFQLINDTETTTFVAGLSQYGLTTSPSGGAGLCALACLDATEKKRLGINPESRVLAYLSEGAEDDQ